MSFVRKKVVERKLKSGELKKYVYYEEVKGIRDGDKVTQKFIQHLGKEPPEINKNINLQT